MAKLLSARASAILIAIVPVMAAVLVYQLDGFDPAPFPDEELTHKGPPLFVPNRNTHMLRGSEKIGYGQLMGPEDIAYDPKRGVIYTGCRDGWLSRVIPDGSAVDKWVYTGGRPLGIVHGLHAELIVADADKEAYTWELLQRYPSVRKVIAILERYKRRPRTEKNGGVIAVDLDGKPTAHYYDPDVSLISSGIKIGEHLYCGSLVYPYILRLNLTRYPATPAG